jgi:hypothetical protein
MLDTQTVNRFGFPLWKKAKETRSLATSEVYIASGIVICIASLIGIIFAYFALRRNTTIFNILSFLYVTSTMISATTITIVESSKIFGVVGMVHNMVEISFLSMPFSGGKLQVWNFIVCMLYLCACSIAILILPNPTDSHFFVTQGLFLDWLLFFMWIAVCKNSRRSTDRITDRNTQRKTKIKHIEIDNSNQSLGIVFAISASFFHAAVQHAFTWFKYQNTIGRIIFASSYLLVMPFYGCAGLLIGENELNFNVTKRQVLVGLFSSVIIIVTLFIIRFD